MGAYERLIARRAAHEPIALITGKKEFWSLEFAVTAATLVPRADSEAVIEAALEPGGPIRTVLDLGTGSGCLLLAVLSERPGARGLGIDRSDAAATVARANASALGLGDRSLFVVGDWAAAAGDRRYDRVLCNPPYIATNDLAGLMPDVARFEPRSALDGGGDGLNAYRRIVPDLPRLLSPGGRAVLEVGIGQAGVVGAMAEATGLVATIRRDLAGIERVVVAEAR